MQKLAGAVKTILECVGEDADRDGLEETPMRYAKALMYFTKGYEENVRDLINGAVFHEDHDELVIVRDIEVFSMCEHHLVPFTGKVSIVSASLLPYIHVDGLRCISGTFQIVRYSACPSLLDLRRCFHGGYKFKRG